MAGNVRAKQLADEVMKQDGSVAMDADMPLGSNKITGVAAGTAATDGINKGQLDAVSAGLNWIAPVSVKSYLGTRTIAEVNSLTPTSGDSVVVSDAGTPTEGTSDALAAGDITEFNGTDWKKIVTNSGGFPPDGTRALVDTDATLFSPLTDATDDGKVAEWDGASLTPSLTTQTDGDAAMVAGEASVNENTGYVFDGVVPTGSWIAFTGTQAVIDGAGLSYTGNILNVGDAGRGVQVNADDLEIDGSEIASTGLEEDGTNSWQLRLAAQGNGIAGGAGSTLSVDVDSETGGDIQPVNLTANGVGLDVAAIAGDGLAADGSANLDIDLDGDSMSVSASGVKSSVPDPDNKQMTASVTASDEVIATVTTLTTTPGGDGYVGVRVNGIHVEVGNGVKAKACYFTDDSGTTAKAVGAIASGDELFWVGSAAGFELDATDRIDFVFNAIQ